LTPAKRRSGKPALLEDCVQSLELLGFHEFTNGSFKRAEVINARYIIRGYSHLSLYGTRGSKEALIVAPTESGCFILDEDGIARIIVEAKWQETSGSVDEKLPYIWEAFLVSPIRNWIVVLDGRYWKTDRGKAAVAWLTSRARFAPEGRQMHVVDRRAFRDLARRAWGRAA
jgi:hypothetical protein